MVKDHKIEFSMRSRAELEREKERCASFVFFLPYLVNNNDAWPCIYNNVCGPQICRRVSKSEQFLQTPNTFGTLGYCRNFRQLRTPEKWKYIDCIFSIEYVMKEETIFKRWQIWCSNGRLCVYAQFQVISGRFFYFMGETKTGTWQKCFMTLPEIKWR